MKKITIPRPHMSEWMLFPVLLMLLPFGLIIISISFVWKNTFGLLFKFGEE